MKRLLCALLFSATAIFGSFAQSALQPLAIVKLNGHEFVTLKELKDQVEAYQNQAQRKFSVEERKVILESIIDHKLIIQAAKKEGFTVADSIIDQNYVANISQIAGRQVTEKEFADYIRQTQGKSVDEYFMEKVNRNVAQYKEYLRNQYIAQQYVMEKKKSEIMAVQPTDADIKNFYELNKGKMIWNDMLRMFLVSVPKNGNPEAAKSKITKMMTDYTAGKLTADSMRIAMKNKTAQDYIAGDMMIEKTETYAAILGVSFTSVLEIFNEPVNKVSELKETDGDYQFYVILEKYNAKMLGLSDVVQPGTTLTVYEYIKMNLTQQMRSAALLKAIQDISVSLNIPENVERKKTGAELDKILSW